MRGHDQGQQTGREAQVYRKESVTDAERVQREEAHGTTLHVRVRPSEVVIIRLKVDKDLKKVLGRKAKSHQVGREKGKYN